MTFEQWCEKLGINASELTEGNRAALEAKYQAELKASANPPAGDPAPQPVNASGTTGTQDPPAGDPPQPDPVVAMRNRLAAEQDRVNRIQAMCGAAHADIAAQAIREGWDATRTELQMLRAARPQAPAIHGAGSQSGITAAQQTLAIEAACRMGSSEPSARIEADRLYTPQILEAAHKMRGMSIRALIEACCRMEGRAVPSLTAGEDIWAAVGFSTVSLPGILSNTANKMLLSAYNAVPALATLIACKLSAKNFQTHTGYRLGSGKVLPQVGTGGELTRGKLSEDSFTFFVDTYGEIIALTRKMLKNDDLGAFFAIPLMIGEKAGYTREYLFWTLVKANTGAFFGAGNKNYVTAAPVNATGYDKATQALEEMTDKNGNQIMVIPALAICPPALAAGARRMYTSQNLAVVSLGSTSTKALEGAQSNYAGMYQPMSIPFLKGQDSDWYLAPKPGNEAAFGIAYLNGAETPVVEQVPVPADCLGQAWRGYFDVGVCQVNPRLMIKSHTT